MIIEIKGKSVSNNSDVLLYYSQFAKKPLFTDLINLQKVFIKDKDGKINAEKIMESEDFLNFFKNLYFSGRCAFEDKLISISELKEEATVDLLMDINFYNKMYEFIGGIVPKETKKKAH